MNKELKELFIRVIRSKGVDSWTAKHKENYISELKNLDNPLSKELHLNVLKSGLTPEEIFEKIKDIDIDLKVFIKFLHEHESYARKSVYLYKFDPKEEQKKDILSNINIKDYTHVIPKNWEPIEVSKEGNIITILIGKLAYQTTNIDLNEKKFTDTVAWDSIKEILLNSTANDKNFDTLKNLKANLLQEKRIVSKVKLDLSNKYLELSVDNSYVQEDGSRIKEEESLKDKKAVFEIVKNKLNLDSIISEKLESLIVHDKAEDSLINEKSFNKLNDLKEENFIVISKFKSFSVKHESRIENDENVIASQDNQRRDKLEKAVKEYYDKRGNLSGFLKEYPQFDTNSGEVTGDLSRRSRDTNEDRVKTKKFQGWGVLVRNETLSNSESKKKQSKGYMEGKVVDIITIELDKENRKLNIANNNYSKEIYETIISKLL